MNDVDRIAADLARQRADLEAEKLRRQRRNQDLSAVLAKLEQLRSRIERSRRDAGEADDELS
jgi:hypothetical protein